MPEIKSVRKVWAPWADANTKPFVRIEKVSKHFTQLSAVNDLSLDIYEKEFFSLLGPSGCGKTTLLRMLAGFETPDSGRVIIDGEDMSTVPPHLRPVNMMFQSYALFPHLTVAENIAFGLKQEKQPKAYIQQRVMQMLELVKLEAFAKRKPDQLSGGQRQRVALARSLAKKPKLLLLDEPLGALDRKLREQTQFELMTIQEELGITFVIVTHDKEEAMTVSSRIAVMAAGEIVQIASPNEIYEHPNSRHVAEFIGDINLFDGELASIEPNRAIIQIPGLSAPIINAHGTGGVVGAKVSIGIRPEKMLISRQPFEEMQANVLRGTVEDIAYLGNLSVFVVKQENGRIIRVVRTNRSRSGSAEITWQDKVYVSWTADAVIVLFR